MALYRQVYLSFWTDPKVDDDFTPEDKYFYLYLLTNPHTNICGCYEISLKQMSRETGYNEDTIHRLLKRMESVHNVIRYSHDTKEVLILKWGKYNWTKSKDLLNSIVTTAGFIKDESFRAYILSEVEGGGTVPPRSIEGVGTSVTDTVTDTANNNIYNSKPVMGTGDPLKYQNLLKRHFGEGGNVRLTDDEYERLKDKYPDADDRINALDLYIGSKGDKYKSHYMTILNWDRMHKEKDGAKSSGNVFIDLMRRESMNEQAGSGTDTRAIAGGVSAGNAGTDR